MVLNYVTSYVMLLTAWEYEKELDKLSLVQITGKTVISDSYVSMLPKLFSEVRL